MYEATYQDDTIASHYYGTATNTTYLNAQAKVGMMINCEKREGDKECGTIFGGKCLSGVFEEYFKVNEI
jgi:hypothetical protein